VKNKSFIPILVLGCVLTLLLTACNVAGTASNPPLPTQVNPSPTPTFALATPYASQPAAGICAKFDGEIVTVTLNTDLTDPRCTKIRSDQKLNVVNNTLSTLRVSIGDFQKSMLPGETWSIDVPFGDYLAVGVHQLAVTPCCGAELWLEASK
jgi:hypothetical protein